MGDVTDKRTARKTGFKDDHYMSLSKQIDKMYSDKRDISDTESLKRKRYGHKASKESGIKTDLGYQSDEYTIPQKDKDEDHSH